MISFSTILSTIGGLFSSAQTTLILLATLAILVGGAWLFGDYHGHSVCSAEWEAKYAAAQLKAQQEHDAMQSRLDLATNQYNSEKAAREADYVKSQQELNHVLVANPAFTKCHSGSDFMRLYNHVAGNPS